MYPPCCRFVQRVLLTTAGVRQETLRRLEEEQNDFAAFLERLRFAKDKSEFDQFMADRRRNPQPPQGGDGTQNQG